MINVDAYRFYGTRWALNLADDLGFIELETEKNGDLLFRKMTGTPAPADR